MKSFRIMMLFSLILFFVSAACKFGTVTLVIDAPSATPTANPIPPLSQNIPGYIEGTVIDKPTRDWSAGPAQGMFRLVVRTTGGDVTVPVDVETFARVWWDQSIQLDCQQMPCVRVGLITGKVTEVSQIARVVTLDLNGTPRTFDVDQATWLSVKVGQLITLDCKDLPCVGEGE